MAFDPRLRRSVRRQRHGTSKEDVGNRLNATGDVGEVKIAVEDEKEADGSDGERTPKDPKKKNARGRSGENNRGPPSASQSRQAGGWI